MELVIITGTNGKLGETYLEHIVKLPQVKCLAIIRKEPLKNVNGVEYKFADLLNSKQVKKLIDSIDFSTYAEIIFIHPVGMFKFELLGFPGVDKDKDGIDDEVFASNVLTFLHIFNALKQKVEKIKGLRFTICAFGSISDKYNIPFWKSYTKPKDF